MQRVIGRCLPASLAAATGMAMVAALGMGATSSAQAVPVQSEVRVDTVLHAGDTLVSPSGQYQFAMQADGNAVIYGVGHQAIWFTGQHSPGATFVGQSDGSIVEYSAAHAVLWQAHAPLVAPDGNLALDDRGQLGLYRAESGGVYSAGLGVEDWSTMSYQNALQPGATLSSGYSLWADKESDLQLIMQADGNLVEYEYPIADAPAPQNLVVWDSGTFGHPGATATLQTDGNFVVYDANHHALWDSKTNGTTPRSLVLQPDANLVIYTSNGGHSWASSRFYVLV